MSDPRDLLQPFPVMGTSIPPERYRKLDLSAEATGGFICDPYYSMGEWIRKVDEDGRYCAYGGYLEKRGFYTAGQYVKNPSNVRNIHLGVDIWLPAGIPVYAPFDGLVHSYAFNDKPLDYGGTIILEHREGPFHFYSLYGHLSKASIKNIEVGQCITRGSEFCQLGGKEENGGWYPHLHLQLIKDIGRFSGDYPGVVAEQNGNIISNCPDPSFMVLPDIELPTDL
nr:peptidoglycan DD-metalloendopeptidase family protein [Saprospiraceae bacterium]